MSSGEAQVDAWIASLRGLPRELRAQRFAEIALEDVKRTAAAGTSPTGVAWKPRKDGSRALENAASHLSAVVSGQRIHLVLKGPDAIHNYGTTKDPKRQVLPTTLPATMAGKLVRAAFKFIRRGLRLR